MSMARSHSAHSVFLLASVISAYSLPVSACSFVDVAASVANAVATAKLYWIASAFLSFIIIIMELFGRRRTVVFVLATVPVIIHPSWTVPPFYDTACRFIKLEVSQTLLFLLTLLLAYELIHFIRSRSLTIRT